MNPKPGRCGAKLRGSKPPRYCAQYPLKGRKKCALHGGKTPRGIESPHFKTGEHSIAFKEAKLQKRFDAALSNPKLMDLREDLALLDTLKGAHVEEHGTGGGKQLMRILEQKRRALDTLVRIERNPDHSMPAADVLMVIRQLVALFLDIVSDKRQAAQFIEGVSRLIGRAQVIDVTPDTAP